MSVYTYKGNEISTSKRHLHFHGHSIIFHNSQDIKTVLSVHG
jgi:hypothetical protein